MTQSKFALLNLRTGEPEDQLQLGKTHGVVGPAQSATICASWSIPCLKAGFAFGTCQSRKSVDVGKSVKCTNILGWRSLPMEQRS